MQILQLSSRQLLHPDLVDHLEALLCRPLRAAHGSSVGPRRVSQAPKLPSPAAQVRSPADLLPIQRHDLHLLIYSAMPAKELPTVRELGPALSSSSWSLVHPRSLRVLGVATRSHAQSARLRLRDSAESHGPITLKHGAPCARFCGGFLSHCERPLQSAKCTWSELMKSERSGFVMSLPGKCMKQPLESDSSSSCSSPSGRLWQRRTSCSVWSCASSDRQRPSPASSSPAQQRTFNVAEKSFESFNDSFAPSAVR